MTGAVACPACGRDVFVTAGSGEVCPACGWRDDPNGRADPDLPGDAGVSLSEAPQRGGLRPCDPARGGRRLLTGRLK